MLNKLTGFIRQYHLVQPGDTVICAVSGGADSVALLFGLYLLKEKLGIRLEAAHFNHHLRGEESDRDEAFVRALCQRYDIPLHMGGGTVFPGEKGLEAAARDARYGFLNTLPGKIATAHTADDNAETVLMHLVRGTGLKGLGGIMPLCGKVIRPMLGVTRENVEAFCAEWCLSYVTDSSNDTDLFLRNRLRHHVMPLLKRENPCLAENLSAMALRLRQDAQYLAEQTQAKDFSSVTELKSMHPALRSRALEGFLKHNGVPEPQAEHISQAEALVFSEKPSAYAHFPEGVVIARCYDRLERLEARAALEKRLLPCPGSIELPQLGLRVRCGWADRLCNTADAFTVLPEGEIFLRCRQSGDSIRLSGGTRSLKKLFIDRKIPAARRLQIPVICDSRGILGVYDIGADLNRAAAALPAVKICFEKI